MNIMNLEWYRIFMMTARLGNLTRAAQELHMTQPSVSYAVKQLEVAMGVKLFDRLSKGVKLTAEGASLLGYVEQSFSLLEAGEKTIQSLKDFEAGELRIAASGPVLKHLLLPPLDRFRAAYPGVRIRLLQGRSAEIAAKLKEGSVDIGLVHLPLADPDLEVKPMAAIQDGFVVGEAYREWTDRLLTARELAQLPLLMLSRGSSTRMFAERWFAEQGERAEADIELGSLDLLAECCERGYGAAFVTRGFVEPQLRAGKLFELRTAAPIPARSVGLLTRKAASLPLAARLFIDTLELPPQAAKPV